MFTNILDECTTSIISQKVSRKFIDRSHILCMQIESLEGIEDEIQCCQDICYAVTKCAGYWRTVPFAVIVMSQYIKWFYLKQFSNVD
jgi:hypothetical protein